MAKADCKGHRFARNVALRNLRPLTLTLCLPLRAPHMLPVGITHRVVSGCVLGES
jgi:hypothetical protein